VAVVGIDCWLELVALFNLKLFKKLIFFLSSINLYLVFQLYYFVVALVLVVSF
jgi:hypothetical protein